MLLFTYILFSMCSIFTDDNVNSLKSLLHQTDSIYKSEEISLLLSRCKITIQYMELLDQIHDDKIKHNISVLTAHKILYSQIIKNFQSLISFLSKGPLKINDEFKQVEDAHMQAISTFKTFTPNFVQQLGSNWLKLILINENIKNEYKRAKKYLNLICKKYETSDLICKKCAEIKSNVYALYNLLINSNRIQITDNQKRTQVTFNLNEYDDCDQDFSSDNYSYNFKKRKAVNLNENTVEPFVPYKSNKECFVDFVLTVALSPITYALIGIIYFLSSYK